MLGVSLTPEHSDTSSSARPCSRRAREDELPGSVATSSDASAEPEAPLTLPVKYGVEPYGAALGIGADACSRDGRSDRDRSSFPVL